MSLQQTLVIYIITNLFVVYGSQTTEEPPFSFLLSYYSVDCGEGCVDCGEGFFQCGNSTECVFQTKKCNGDRDCWDGEDEEESLCTGPYTCNFNSAKLTAKTMQHRATYNEPRFGYIQQYNSKGFAQQQEAHEIAVKVAEGFAASGLDLQDNLTIMSLLLMNVVISIFIIIGLTSYHNKKHFQYIDISYIIIVIIILQHILISSVNLFAFQPLYCTINGREIGSPFDVLQYLSPTILWLLWVKFFYNEKNCAKSVCALYIVTLAFVIPCVLSFVVGVEGFIFPRGYGSYLVLIVSQMSLCIIWLLILMQEANKLNGGCTGCIKRPCGNNVCCHKHKTWYGYILIMTLLQRYVVIDVWNMEIDVNDVSQLLDNSCLLFSGLLWFNPMWIIINVILLFSSARCPVIMYNIIIFFISIFGIKVSYMCLFVINANFVVHSLLIPVYMIFVFYSVKELSQWKTDLIQMYLVAFDIVTDIIVIHYFIDEEEYIFATLSITFIILGQIIGSFSEYCTVDKADRFIETTADKVLVLLGFSGPWFIIKSWSDRKYFQLQHKHQIWEIMFEKIPAVALQIYAAITQKKGGVSLSLSITVSAVTITFSIWMYLVKLTRLKRESRGNLEDNDNAKVAAVDLKVISNQSKREDGLPDGWRQVSTVNGKIYYRNDVTKQTQWTKPVYVAPVPYALPQGWRCVLTFDGRMYYQNDITKQTQWAKPIATAAITAKGRNRVMTTEEIVFEEGMHKLKRSKAVPKFIRRKFAEVLIYRTLFVNLYFFMISDFYIRSMSITIFISSIPCPQDVDFCVARNGIGSALFLVLLIFAFIMNKRMRIESYQSCCFISTIFGVSLLSSFYNVLSSLKILKDDTFFGKSVCFKSLLFEHKIRVWISFSLNVVSICFFFLYDASRNALIGTLMLLFFVALAINYFTIAKVARYIDSEKRYTFNMFKCNESGVNKQEEISVVIQNKEKKTKQEEIKTEEEASKEKQTKEEQTNTEEEVFTETNNVETMKEVESNDEAKEEKSNAEQTMKESSISSSVILESSSVSSLRDDMRECDAHKLTNQENQDELVFRK